MDSFKCTLETLKTTLAEHGVAILEGLLDAGECAAMEAGMWHFVEHITSPWPTPVSRDPSTWRGFVKKMMPKNGLLQYGVGHAQFAWDVRQNPKVVEVFETIWGTPDLVTSVDGWVLGLDPRVTNLEKINARNLRAEDLPRPDYDVIVMDLSFISLKSVLPAVWPLLRTGGTLVALVKPQFEAGKAEVDKGRGIIRDTAVQDAVLADIKGFALAQLPAAQLVGTMDSPITGTDGNREFLLGLRKAP